LRVLRSGEIGLADRAAGQHGLVVEADRVQDLVFGMLEASEAAAVDEL
jgi:hypothetical protein